MTYWALSENKLPAEPYFNWARDHFEVSSLNQEAHKIELDLSLWERVQTLPHWSCEVIPITEWDGVIFIACTEPCTDINWNFPVQYILTHPTQLEHFWNQLSDIPLPDTANKRNILSDELLVDNPQELDGDISGRQIDNQVDDKINSQIDSKSKGAKMNHRGIDEITVTPIDPLGELTSSTDEPLDFDKKTSLFSKQKERDITSATQTKKIENEDNQFMTFSPMDFHNDSDSSDNELLPHEEFSSLFTKDIPTNPPPLDDPHKNLKTSLQNKDTHNSLEGLNKETTPSDSSKPASIASSPS